MSSLENRDAPTAEERNGILKAVSVRSGKCRMESTTYDSLDYALREASGSLYLFIKSWCSLVLLKHCAQQMGDMDVAARAETMLSKCRESEKCLNPGKIPGCVQIFIPMCKVPCQPLRNRWRFLYVGDTDKTGRACAL